MVRTNVVKLTVIPAIAFRQRLTAGDTGIVIMRADASQPGIASISKTSGKAIPAANVDQKLYPEEAFDEALKLTVGMPFRKQKNVKITEDLQPVPVDDESGKIEEEVVVDSAEYQKIVDAYTDKNGKLSYDLMNKDFIKFAHSSSIVRKMIEDGKSTAAIRNYIVSNKFRNIAGNDKLDSKQLKKIVDMLDEVSPKGVFKELNAEIRKMQSKSK